MYRKALFGLILLAGFGTSAAIAQCKSLAKTSCVPSLGDYLPNGRLYQSVVEKGTSGELHMVLNGGQHYRIITCADEKLGATEWVLKDANGKVLFDNREHNMAQVWDIEVSTTQEFVMELEVGEKRGVGRGCSCVLVGYKRSPLDQLSE
ncbi:MAG: hypothetical protein H6585_07790 [Flavobacteriales bacterium]|nr:hypothetical protein [Flavobacteriales bacterium]MCB9448228.1 hypothetical protein [Flavobacteriales bacterium]